MESNALQDLTSAGEMLKKELKHLGITQKQFAEVVGVSASHLNEIIKGHREMSVKFTEKLQASLSIPASVWLEIQANYNLAAKNTKSYIDEIRYKALIAEYDEIVSVKDILRHEKISTRSSKEKINILTTVYKIPSPKALLAETTSVGGLFKKSAKQGLDSRMIATWIVMAKHEARKHSVNGIFDKKNLFNLSTELRKAFHQNTNTLKSVSDILSSYGIRFCIVDKVDHASIDGFSFIENNIPSIVVTLRHKRIDNLAFSVLHEVCHIFKHLKNDLTSIVSISNYDNESREEIEANTFAANTLIPKAIWDFAPNVPMNPYIIQLRYSEWARRKGLNKWIVLGRVSHETGMYKFKTDESRNIH